MVEITRKSGQIIKDKKLQSMVTAFLTKVNPQFKVTKVVFGINTKRGNL